MTKIGYGMIVGGAFIILASVIKWMFLFPFMTALAFGISIGMLIMFLGYAYNWMRKTDKDIDKLEERIDAIVSWWMKMEKSRLIRERNTKIKSWIMKEMRQRKIIDRIQVAVGGRLVEVTVVEAENKCLNSVFDTIQRAYAKFIDKDGNKDKEYWVKYYKSDKWQNYIKRWREKNIESIKAKAKIYRRRPEVMDMHRRYARIRRANTKVLVEKAKKIIEEEKRIEEERRM